MSFLTVDFETFYSSTYSLTKLTTEEYITHSEFEVIGVSVKVDDQPAQWFSGTHAEIQRFLDQFDWANSAVLCHNTQFDGAILGWIFGIYPAYYFDTLCMARALLGVEVGGSLAKLVRHYEVGEKGNEVINALGLHRVQFSPTQLNRYALYCVNDVELTYKLFGRMSDGFPESEHDLIDLTLRMYIEPTLKLDSSKIATRLSQIKEEKESLLGVLRERLNCDDNDAVVKKLRSDKQFAQILKEHGVVVPTKISPTTGKETTAFAKTDLGFIELEQHDDPFVQQLCAARLGSKSTIEETRLESFLDIAARNDGKLPIPLKYYGAHTGRWSGLDGINMQNIPTRDKRKRALKESIVAPPGHVIINADSSQIEARVLAWLAGQKDLVDAFRAGRDVYSEFASMVYKRNITKANVNERFVGKTCILGLGYGTGPTKLSTTLKIGQGDIHVDMSPEQCRPIVYTYRGQYNKIPDLWEEGDRLLHFLASWPERGPVCGFGQHEVIKGVGMGIVLPNGLMIRYPNLQISRRPDSYGKMTYDGRKGPTNVWGGVVTENVVQALARIIISEQMIKVSKKYKVALTVHDSIVIVVPEAAREEAVGFVTEIMSTPPNWAPGLPVACETKWGVSYGDC